MHLYCTDRHLRHLAEQIWDKSPASISLDEKVFSEDVRITQLYRHFLLSSDWQQNANHLMLSSASTLLMTHLLQHYSEVLWKLPAVRVDWPRRCYATLWRLSKSILPAR